MTRLDTDIELDIVTVKLTRTASLWWRYHKKTYNMNSVNRIRIWKQLRDILLQYKVIDEYERQILSQLDIIQQKSTVQEYNITFEKLTMQISDLPLKVEMHYYLKGLKQELR